MITPATPTSAANSRRTTIDGDASRITPVPASANAAGMRIFSLDLFDRRILVGAVQGIFSWPVIANGDGS
jgi:hypothetical protein